MGFFTRESELKVHHKRQEAERKAFHAEHKAAEGKRRTEAAQQNNVVKEDAQRSERVVPTQVADALKQMQIEADKQRAEFAKRTGKTKVTAVAQCFSVDGAEYPIQLRKINGREHFVSSYDHVGARHQVAADKRASGFFRPQMTAEARGAFGLDDKGAKRAVQEETKLGLGK